MPGIKLVELGDGVRSLSGAELISTALKLEGTPRLIQSTPAIEMEIVAVKEEKALHTALGFSMSESGAAPLATAIGEVDLSIEAKANFSKQISFDAQHIYFMIKKRVTSSKMLADNSVMRDSAARLAITSEGLNSFYALYGDKFIDRVTTGSEVIAIIKVDSSGDSASSAHSEQLNSNVGTLQTNIQSAMSGQGSKDSFQGGSNSACWIYVTGVKNAKSFVMDSRDLGSMMTSLHELMKFDSDPTSETSLSYRTSSYSTVQLDPDALCDDFSLDQNSLTRSLLSLEGYIREVKGLYEDLSIAQIEVNTYLSKYETLWVTMNREHEKYRGSDAFELCEKSRNDLRGAGQRLTQITGDLVSQLYEKQHLEEFKLELTKIKSKARKVIDDYSAREGYQYLKTVRPDEAFSLFSTNARVNYFFWKASDSQISFHLQQQKHSSLDPAGCLGCGLSYKPVVVEPLKGKGDYTSVGLFKKKQEYVITPSTNDNPRFHVDIFTVESDKVTSPSAESEGDFDGGTHGVALTSPLNPIKRY